MTLNVPTLTRIAEWLEAGAPPAMMRGCQFDMGPIIKIEDENYIDDSRGRCDERLKEDWCGSACCIAGAAIILEAPELAEVAEIDRLENAASILGLPWHDFILTGADHLFSPWQEWRDDWPGDSKEASDPAWAARTIRLLILHYQHTGEIEVDWATTRRVE